MRQASPKHAIEVAGPEGQSDFISQPVNPSGTLTFASIDELREWLEMRQRATRPGQAPLVAPMEVSVSAGMFFACGLLKAGWWTKAERPAAGA